MAVFEARAHWSGSTGAGWDSYDRAHAVSAPPAEQGLTVTTGESHGDPSLLNPEQLVVAAASSCQLLWFLHLAAKARIDVVEYEDRARAHMPAGAITEIVLRPRIVVAGDPSEARVRRLCELAHRECNVAKSLSGEVRVQPELERR
ncbi:MAG: OsmC family protein [Thermoleophilaceae bacterium]